MQSKAQHSVAVLPLLITGVVLTCFVATLALAADPDMLLPPGAAGDTTADAVLGQLDFVHTVKDQVDARGVNLGGSISHVAIDKSVTPNRVYVTDTFNSRVLGWTSVAAFATHAPANIVIGQPDFLSNVCNNGGVSATSLCLPAGVAVDAAGNLYVADQANNRVLEYNRPFSQDVTAGIAADEVFGQYGSFTTNFCDGYGLNAETLCSPIRVAVDSTRNLYVADQANNRVLEYHTPKAQTAVPGSGDTAADRVFGQANFTSSTCNAGGVSANSLCQPAGLAIDGNRNLYVADTGNSRVLEYNTPLTTNTTADRVFGQSVFNTNACNQSGPPSATTLCQPTNVAVDSASNLYVADRSNHRVLEYNTPLTTNTTADRVFGQFGSFTINACNNTNINPQSLCHPDGIAVDSANNLYVADTLNNRFLKSIPSPFKWC